MKYIYILIAVFFTCLTFSQTSGIELNATVSVENNQIKNVTDPTEDGDAVNLGFLNERLDYYQNQIDELQSLLENLQLQLQQVVDQDGNSYQYLTYGEQFWTVQNAEVVTYRDGTPIPQLADQDEWYSTTTGAWCYFDNDPTKGKLYNWYAVAGIHDDDPNTTNKQLAPEGWHVPSDSEWTTLEEHLIANGYNYDGTTTENKIAKAMASTTGWNSSTQPGAPGNDQSQNNSSGFNAFPEGDRNYNGSFYSEDYNAPFWSSTEYDTNWAYARNLYNYGSNLVRHGNYSKRFGFSVRFVKD